MTKIVTMQDPRGVSGRDITVVDSGQQAVDLIYKFMPHFNCDESVAYINNVKLNMPKFEGDDVVDRGDEDELTRPLTDDDVLVIVNEPKGVFVATFLIAAAVAAAVAYFMVPDVPGSESKASSNNDLYGQRNAARVYQAIPDIYGNIVSYPDLITAEASKYFSGNQPNIRQIMCVGVGYYDIPVSEMKLGGTPITQVPGVTVDIYEPDQEGITTIPNYEHHTSVSEVNGQELVGLGSATVQINGAEVNYDSATDVATITDTIAAYTEQLASGDSVTLVIDNLDNLNASHTLSSVTSTQITIENASTFSSKWAARDPSNYPFNVTNGSVQRFNTPSVIGPYDTVAKGDALVLDIKYTRGLVGKSVQVRVQWHQIDAPGGNTTGVSGTRTFTHTPVVGPKTYDAQDRTMFLDISGVGGDKNYYRVSVSRLNETSDDTEKPDLAKWARLASVVREPEKKLANVTIVDLNVPGTQAALSPRDNNLNMSVTRKTVTYDSVTGEVVETLAPSKKFADAVLHEHYKTFDRPLDEIDLDELYEIQESIDAVNPSLGEFSFTFDDIDVSLGERIEAMCAVARVRTYRDGTVWRFTRDEVKDIDSGLITRKDIAAEREYSRTWKPRLPSEHDSVQVEFVDPDTNKKAYVYRSFKNESIAITAGANPLEIKLAGCRNREQAENRANLEIRRLIYDGWILTDTLLIQGNMYDLGQVVRYSDVYNDTVADGEILYFDGVDTVTVSEKVLLDNTGLMMFTGEFGEVYGPFPVNRVTNGNQLVETDTFKFLPTPDFDSVKSNIILNDGIRKQLGSRFVLAIEASKEVERFVVSGKEPRSDGTVQLTFTEYDERLYIEGPAGSGEVGNPGGGVSLPESGGIAPVGQWERSSVSGFSGNVSTSWITHISPVKNSDSVALISNRHQVAISSDGGNTFGTPQQIPNTSLSDAFGDVSSSGTGTIYLVSGSELHRSIDNGLNWEFEVGPSIEGLSRYLPYTRSKVSCFNEVDAYLMLLEGKLISLGSGNLSSYSLITDFANEVTGSLNINRVVSCKSSNDGVDIGVSVFGSIDGGDVQIYNFISNDSGTSWIMKDPLSEIETGVTWGEIYIDHVSYDGGMFTVSIEGFSDSFYQSVDGGSSFDKVTLSGVNSVFSTDSASGGIIIKAGSGSLNSKVYMTVDNGENWNSIPHSDVNLTDGLNYSVNAVATDNTNWYVASGLELFSHNKA